MFLGIAGCGSVAWKQGAGATDLQRDETECRAQQPSDDAAAKCMRDKGWTITQFGAPEDVVAQSPARTSKPAVNDESDTAESAPTGTIAVTPLASDAEGKDPTLNAKAPTADTKTTTSANAKINVQSWWKAGAQAADFNNDANGCVATLGVEHTPDYAKRLYSYGLTQCLRDKGWHAGANPIYAPSR